MPYVGNKSTTFNTFSATDVSVTDDLTVTDDASVGGDLTLTGSLKNGSTNFTVDSSGDVILNADGRAIIFADDTVSFGHIQNLSGGMIIECLQQDKDIYFYGNDGGSSVLALTLDMSNAGAATLNNGLTLTDGDLVVADGHGISFAATSNGGTSTISEILTDYERGTFTPTMSFVTAGNSSVSYIARTGNYIKIGSVVTFATELRLNVVTYGTGSGHPVISGFPYNFLNTSGYGGSLCIPSLQGTAISSGHTPIAWGVSNSDDLYLMTMSNTASNASLVISNYNTIGICGSYITQD